MTKQKEAAAPTATATQENNATKLVNSAEKSKFSYLNLLDRIMRFSYDSESNEVSLVDSVKNDIRISEEIAKAHTSLPINCFPSSLQKIITQFAAENETCVNFVSTNVLVVAGSAVGANLNIKDGSYENLPVLFGCVVGTPSQGKTPSMRSVIKPLQEINDQRIKQFRTEYAAWKRGKDTSSPEPHCEQIIIDDATPEAIVQVHDYNRRGVLIFADEATRFFKNIDKYSGGDFISTLRKSWSGDPIVVNRKSEAIPVNINNPFISLLCGLQPGKLKEIFGPYLDDGFDQRFLFVFPNETEQKKSVDDAMHNIWKNIIISLRRRTPSTLFFDERSTLFLEKFNRLIRELAKDCEGEGGDAFSEWVLKQNYLVRRISGILHVLDGDNMGNMISLETVKKAIRLSISYGYHFLRFLEVIHEKERKAHKIRIGEALKMVVERYRLFEDVKVGKSEKIRKAFTLNSLAKTLGISQATIWEHLNQGKNEL